jgi:all-trans-8'-apo-beta-carotenal 15,15'-oxygenase
MQTQIRTAPYTLEDWRKGYRSQPQEFDYWIDEIEGEIPQELKGTLYRNGPGLLDINGQRFRHPFDGDGMVSAIAFEDGRAHYRNRFVRTAAYVEEQEAQRILYRGVFGTQKPGGWLANAFDLRLKNIANTQIIYWGGKLLALWEAAEPHRLDPRTLDTLGIDYLGGLLQPGSAFAAHPRVDPHCAQDGNPCFVNFSIKTGLSSTITVYELSPQGDGVRQHSHAVPGFAFMHDFAITENYCVFFQNPVAFNPLPFLFGLKGAGECLSVDRSKPTNAVIIPRFGSRPVQIIPMQSGFVFHHANAFEQDGQIVVDSVCYDSLPSVEPGADYLETKFDALNPGQLWRFHFDLEAGTAERQLIDGRCVEFPALHPGRMGRPYRYLYIGAAHQATGNAPLQAVLKIDQATGDRQLWSAAPWGYGGEPVFIPRHPSSYRDGLPTPEFEGAEDDGWVVVLLFNAERERSQLVILDAQKIEQGPIATLYLKHHVPYGLHGTFTPQVFLP